MRKETADAILADLREGYLSAGTETASTRERLYWDELRRFVDYVREGEAVLDVGCGDGRAIEVFRAKKIAYAGVDFSAEAIAAAKARWGNEAAFEVGDALELPVPSNRYDAVVAAGVLHHLPSEAYRRKALAELSRAVRPGGYLMIAVWNLWQFRYWGVLAHQLFGWRNGWDFGDLNISWKKPHFPRYYHAFHLKELRDLCEDSGFEVVEQYYVKKGAITGWTRGENLVTIARKR